MAGGMVKPWPSGPMTRWPAMASGRKSVLTVQARTACARAWRDLCEEAARDLLKQLEIREVLARLLDGSRFIRHWKFRVVRIGDGSCTMELPHQPELERPGGRP